MDTAIALKYWAFISYSHFDSNRAKWLHRGLEGFHIDKDLVGRKTATGTIPKSLRPIFRDRDEFTAGHGLSEQTQAALDASHALVVICSPSSVKSVYVLEEIRLFKSRHADRPVIPLIVDGKPGDAELECLPPSLRFKLDAGGQVTSEPIEVLAADVREEGDGKNLALAKVVAGLLGVSSDDVFRRAERERRRRQRTWITGLSVVALMLAGLAVWAEINRREAVIQRAEAFNNETVGLAALSAKALDSGRPVEAIKLALAAWPRLGDSSRPQFKLTLESLARALPQLYERVRLTGRDGVVRSITQLWEHEREDIIQSATFSPDGKLVVTASSDNFARVWDAATGALVRELKGHESRLESASFSPDGKSVVTASYDNTARVWDVATGVETAILTGHEDKVSSASFSRDGRWIVTGSGDKTARLWDAATGSQIASFEGHKGSIGSAFLSPDGTHVLTLSDDGTARLWDAKSGTFEFALNASSAAFSPDGKRVVTASKDKTARIWDVSTGSEIAALTGHTDQVISVVFSPDGKLVVTGSEDKTSRIWNALTGAQMTVLIGHEASVGYPTFSLDGTLVVTASFDKTARVWDVATGTEVAVLKGHEMELKSVDFSPDGKRVLTLSWDNSARVWELPKQREMLAISAHENRILSGSFSRDGTQVITASADKTAKVWTAATGAIVSVLKGHQGSINYAAFSPDGERAVTASSDKTTRIWDASNGAMITTLRGQAEEVQLAVFSPDGTSVLTLARGQFPAWSWNAVNGAAIAKADENGGYGLGVRTGAFSLDGKQVVTVNLLLQASVWRFPSTSAISVLGGHNGLINSVRFSPDGGLVISASIDQTARLWDAASGEQLAILRHGDWVNFAAFSSDGARVVTASRDGTTRLWDVATGAEIGVLRARHGETTSADFSPDGDRVLTTSEDGIALLWDASTIEKGDGFEIACARLGHNTDLTDVRTLYGLGELAPICEGHPPSPVDRSALK
jgi:WD40 repeat protein